jgi:hypothetical protein
MLTQILSLNFFVIAEMIGFGSCNFKTGKGKEWLLKMENQNSDITGNNQLWR